MVELQQPSIAESVARDIPVPDVDTKKLGFVALVNDGLKRSPGFGMLTVTWLIINGIVLVAYLVTKSHIALLIAQPIGFFVGGYVLGYRTGFIPVNGLVIVSAISFSTMITKIFAGTTITEKIVIMAMIAIFISIAFVAAFLGVKAQTRRNQNTYGS